MAHIGSIFNQIVEFDPDTREGLDLRGGVAESWALSEDGLTYNFKLRDNMMFHDGTPLEMKDVLFTLTTAFTPDDIEFTEVKDEIAGRTFPDSEVAMMYLKDWEAVDANTLAINVKFPTSAFLVTFGVHRFPVISKDAVAEHGTFKVPNEGTMVGTGPFMFVKYDKDIVTELERNPNYHLEGRPYLDGLRHYAIFDTGTIIAAYKTEQVMMSSDYVSNLKIPDVLALQEEMGEDKLRVIFASAPVASLGVMMNTARAPFDDARVRKAVNLVLHRQPINQTISGGRNGVGTPVTCGFSWSFTCEEALQMPGVRELNGEKHPDDIAEAQALALAAGAGPGTKLEFSCRLVIEFCDVMQIVKPQLSQWLGWEFTTRSLESVAGYELYRTGQYDIAIQGYGLPFPDPDALAAFLKKGATNNMGRTSYYNEEAEPLWGQISTETDPAKRKALVRQVNDILMEDNSWAIAYHLTFGWPVNTKIKGFIDPVTRSQYLLW
ncbi:MAG TPA: ABC transporter substrate-binding protein, partial [Candidatus Latescibacteria bacterium]|nr:ABC transporter substrate-binding protein [Candidatus Latescibacterota bacterium]